MKKLLFFTILAFSLVSADAQQVIRQASCSSTSIKEQADSIKKVMIASGFVLLKENSVSMKSGYEMPIIVPLVNGGWYYFAFIGEPTARLYEIRMYDWNEKMVKYIKNDWGDVDGNVISYSYFPKFSEYHMIKPIQLTKEKNKDMCGYVILMKKGDAPVRSTTPD